MSASKAGLQKQVVLQCPLASIVFRALDLCRENREAIDKIVELLQEKETIDGKEFRAILSEFTTIPESVREQNKEPILA